MPNYLWSDRVADFLASKRKQTEHTCSCPSTAKQTAWRLRTRFGALVTITARGARVIFTRK